LPPPLSRGIAWLTVWDALLEGRAEPGAVVDLATTALMSENDELLVQRILDYLQSAYWQFLSGEEREKRGPDLEDLLWALVEGVPAPTRKAAYFNAYRSIAVSDSAVARMERLWSGDQVVAGLDLSESDFTRLAQELAVRQVTNWERILQQQRQRIENPDRRRRFEFVEPALSADPMVRERFFASLAQVENREHEPWVIDAVGYLHHPLRASESEKFIRPSLELLQEIQVTGDIFFAKNWLDATLGRRNTPAAAAIVRGFLQRHPDYPPRLTAKILQSADDLFRAVEILAPKR
jgi:aminopeptidase N